MPFSIRKLFPSLLAMVVLPLGCQQQNKPPANQSAPRHKRPEVVHVKQTAPEPRRNQSPQASAQRLVQIATSVPGVKSASAAVLGKYTLVGINVDPTLDRGRVGTIKYTVAEALRDDPLGTNALVTADVDLAQRIREVGNEIRHGHPVAGLTQQLAEIVARIVPQPTRETEKTERPPDKINQERLNQSRHAPARPS